MAEYQTKSCPLNYNLIIINVKIVNLIEKCTRIWRAKTYLDEMKFYF